MLWEGSGWVVYRTFTRLLCCWKHVAVGRCILCLFLWHLGSLPLCYWVAATVIFCMQKLHVIFVRCLIYRSLGFTTYFDLIYYVYSMYAVPLLMLIFVTALNLLGSGFPFSARLIQRVTRGVSSTSSNVPVRFHIPICNIGVSSWEMQQSAVWSLYWAGRVSLGLSSGHVYGSLVL